MKKKRVIIRSVIGFLLLLFAILLCDVVSDHMGKVAFDGSKTGNEGIFDLSFREMNSVESHVFALKEGEAIHTEFGIEKGNLTIRIVKQQTGEEIYKGNQLGESAEFDVLAKEAGNYEVIVDGKKAKGKVRFTIMEKKE